MVTKAGLFNFAVTAYQAYRGDPKAAAKLLKMAAAKAKQLKAKGG